MQLDYEDQFKIKMIETLAAQLDTQDIKDQLVIVYRQMIELDNQYRQRIKEQWRINDK